MHKPVKGVLRLEIEKHQISQADIENTSEMGTNDSVDPNDHIAESSSGKHPSDGFDDPQGSVSKWNYQDGKEASGNGTSIHGNPDSSSDDVSIEVSWSKYNL